MEIEDFKTLALIVCVGTIILLLFFFFLTISDLAQCKAENYVYRFPNLYCEK